MNKKNYDKDGLGLMGYLGLHTSRVTTQLNVVIDILEQLAAEEPEVPIGVLLETENWEKKIQRIKDMSAGQA
jgi:hypothetical protein